MKDLVQSNPGEQLEWVWWGWPNPSIFREGILNPFFWENSIWTGHILTHRVWSKKNETNILHDCVNTNQKIKNLIKTSNCWHLSHSRMVHKLYVSSFFWILGKILSKNKFLKILHFLREKNIHTKIKRVDREGFQFCSKTA